MHGIPGIRGSGHAAAGMGTGSYGRRRHVGKSQLGGPARAAPRAALGSWAMGGGALSLGRRALMVQSPSGLLLASFGAPGDEPDSFFQEEMKDKKFREKRELETKYTSKAEVEPLKFQESELGNLEVFAEEEPKEYEEGEEEKRRAKKESK